MIHRQLIDDAQEFALLIRGRYGRDGEATVAVINKSERPEKQRAETTRLIADLLGWAREQGITVEVEDGKYIVHG